MAVGAPREFLSIAARADTADSSAPYSAEATLLFRAKCYGLADEEVLGAARAVPVAARMEDLVYGRSGGGVAGGRWPGARALLGAPRQAVGGVAHPKVVEALP